MIKKKSEIVFHDMMMVVPIKDGERVVKYDEVMYIECDKPYCVILCAGGVKFKTQATLQLFLKNLPQAFFRCNHKVIINFAHYRGYEKDKNSLAFSMTDGQKLSLSRRKIAEFIRLNKKIRDIWFQCPCYTCSKEKCIPHIVFCRHYTDSRDPL